MYNILQQLLHGF